MGSDTSSQLKEMFKSYPDELVTCEEGHKARDMKTQELELQVQAGRAQVAVLTEVCGRLLILVEKMVDRSLKCSSGIITVANINNIKNLVKIQIFRHDRIWKGIVKFDKRSFFARQRKLSERWSEMEFHSK